MKHLTCGETTPLQVFIQNYGCSSNTSDSETIAGCLKQAGHQIAPTQHSADLIIYNTCAVKGPTENRIINDIKNAPKNKKIIIAGCLPKISLHRVIREVHFDGVVGPASGKTIVEIVDRVMRGETVLELQTKDMPQLTLPHHRTNPVVSVVPINFGCLGSCAYCCVRLARGDLRSYSIQEIKQRIQTDCEQGAKEFWLTSQDTACYGRDLGFNLADLLFELNSLEGDFKVRVGMMTPSMVTSMQHDLIKAFSSPKVFKFLHLPVQSGDNTILLGMQRRYTAEQFKQTVDAFRRAFADLTLATDIIVGFPGETTQAFENTLTVLRDVKPDIVNVSKFFARPKTAAWNMREGLVDKEEIKRRSTVASELAKQLSVQQNKRWVGWRGEVLVDEVGKMEGTWVGRNFAYKPIAIKNTANLLGKTLGVRVFEALGTYLKGEISSTTQVTR